MSLLDYFRWRTDGRAEPAAPPRIEPMEPAAPLGRKTITAAAAIAIAMAALYANEGGYVDHPADRGGKTRYGITENVARSNGYTGHMRAFPKHCDANTRVCADAIYGRFYIANPGFQPLASIEPAILWEAFDSAVLHGPPVPSRWLQQAINAKCGAGLAVDGKVGPRTIAAYQSCQRTLGRVPACVAVLDRMDAAQLAYFKAIVARRPSQKAFYKGWTSHRIGNVDRKACGQGVV